MKSVMDPERTKKGRMQDIRAMRNYHVHFMVPELLDYMRRSGDPEVQQAMLEAFGWFTPFGAPRRNRPNGLRHEPRRIARPCGAQRSAENL